MSNPNRKCGLCGAAGHNRSRCPNRSEHVPPGVQAIMVDLLRQGNFLDTAAYAAGITPYQCQIWLEKGAEPGSEFEDFRLEVQRAMADSETGALGILADAAAEGDIKAVTWFLERRHPKRWAQKVRQTVQEETENIIERVIELEKELGAEAINRVLQAITRGEDSGEALPGENAPTKH